MDTPIYGNIQLLAFAFIHLIELKRNDPVMRGSNFDVAGCNIPPEKIWKTQHENKYVYFFWKRQGFSVYHLLNIYGYIWKNGTILESL